MLTVLLACTVDDAPPVDTGIPAQEGVVLEVLDLVDPSRGHDAYTNLPASDVRPLETWVWLPPGAGLDLVERPVLLLAHGNSGHPEKLETFARAMAEHGAVVAAPVFPVTNQHGDSAGFGIPDLLNQPDDLDFVLAELARLGADEGSPIYRRADTGRVVAMGHSLGGVTVAAWTRWREPSPEVLGTVLVSPAIFLGAIFGEGPLAEGPPVQLVHGARDPLVPPSNSAGFYDDVAPPAAWVELPEAEHSDLIEGDGPLVEHTTALVQGVFDGWVNADVATWVAALDAAEAAGDHVEDKGLR